MDNRYWKIAVAAGSLMIVGAAWLPACSSDEASGGGATTDTPAGGLEAGAGLVCVPGAASCKSETVAQTCGSDGKAFTEQTCGAGERCSGGACVSTTAANLCQDATRALRRKADGTFEVVDCPAGTTCTGEGVCKGAFVVGEQSCADLQNLAKSVDGLTEVLTACTGGQLCVSTGDVAGVPTAACKASECVPSVPNLAFCGNPKVVTAEQNKAITTCVATPDGYKYMTSLCATGTCVPGSKASGSQPATAASCATECVPGRSKCVDGGVATCGADGKFGPVTACASDKACFTSPSDPSKAVCGDAVCRRSYGACASGSFRACDGNGMLGAPAACPSGKCVDDTLGGGICFAECQAGEERCTSGSSTSFQTCVNGNWSSAATSCPSNGACVNTTAAGKRAKICGAQCTPGQTECTSSDAGPGNSSRRVCDAAGKWGAPADCAIGLCQGGGFDAQCVAQCVPNSLVCNGGTVGVPGTPFNGSNAFTTCTAKGLLGPTTTGCAGGTFCRTKNGQAIVPAGATNACIACVGTGITGGNEDNLVDTRCSSADGSTTGSAGSQVCGAANTWVAGGVTACSLGCIAPQTRSGPAAPICGTTRRGDLRTESYFASHRRGSCAASNTGGQPTTCGSTPDCCSNACSRPVAAHPSSCNSGLPDFGADDDDDDDFGGPK